jgi:hypothetical protein
MSKTNQKNHKLMISEFLPARLLGSAIALSLASCAAPKAEVEAAAQAPAIGKTQAATTKVAADAKPPTLPQDGIRLPDMLGLPSDNELRSATTKPLQSGAVIARPPVETPPEP